MDNRSEVREFLTSRRAKVTPQHAGLPETFHRRVPGLRRSEVAALAGMSVEYYAKLERGSLGGVSAGVLDAIARALQLDEAERAHLFHLPKLPTAPAPPCDPAAFPSGGRCGRVCNGPSTPSQPGRRSSVTTGLTCSPATILAGRFTPTSTTIPAPRRTLPGSPSSTARPPLLPDWDLAADISVANLRTAAGQDPHNKSLHDLVGELSTRSDEFRRRWGAHIVRTHGTGTNTFITTSSVTSHLPTKPSTSEPNPGSP